MRACFEEEQPRLLALPAKPFPCEERIVVRVQRPLTCASTGTTTRSPTRTCAARWRCSPPSRPCASSMGAVIAVHPRSFDRDEQIEDPPHIQALVDHKRAGRRTAPSTGCTTPPRVLRSSSPPPHSAASHLGALTRGLIDLLDTHGAAALEAALPAALPRTPRTWPPCATSSTCIAPGAAHPRRSRCICPMIRACATSPCARTTSPTTNNSPEGLP